MKSFTTIILVFHILSGTIALTTGFLSMLNRKGSKVHTITGKIFFWAMTGLFVSATAISLIKGLVFLFMVGFFSYYLTCSGYRSLHLKKLHMEQKAGWVDWLIGYTGLIFGTGLLVFSIISFSSSGKAFSIVPAVFGGISLLLAYGDIRKFYVRPTVKTHWIVSHGMKMSAAFSATVTAFIVVNIQIQQQWILWIAPAAIIPAIARNQIKKFLEKKTTRVFKEAKVIRSQA